MAGPSLLLRDERLSTTSSWRIGKAEIRKRPVSGLHGLGGLRGKAGALKRILTIPRIGLSLLIRWEYAPLVRRLGRQVIGVHCPRP